MSEFEPSPVELRDEAEVLRARVKELQQSQIQTQQIVEGLQSIVQGISSAQGEDFFRALVRHLTRVLGASHGFVGELAGDAKDRIRTLAFWAKDDFIPNFEYRLEGTPSEQVVGQATRYYPDGIRQLFPNDQNLGQSDVESYLGIPLFDSSGKPQGLLAVMHSTAFPDLAIPTSILAVFAAWAAAELERRQAEQALAESQRMLSTLMSNLPGMAYRCSNDRDWTATFVSDGCFDLTGYHPADLINSKKISYGQIIHADDRESVWQGVQSALRANRPYQLTYRIVTADNKEKWVWEQGRGVYSPAGELLALEGFITDITAQKQVEQALREEEERFRAIFEQAADSIVLFDTETGAMMEFNDRACENLGYTRSEFERLVLTDIEAIESTEEVAEHIRKVVEQGPDTFETKQRHKNGKLRDILVTARVISISGRNLIATVWRDITERKRAEEALHEKEERFRAIADYTYDWENWYGTEGQLLWINPAVERLTGYSVEECLAMPDHPYPLIHEDDRMEAEKRFKAAIRGEPGSNFHCRVRCKDGSVLWVAINWQPIFNREGVCIGHRSSLRDVNEQKRAEEALRTSEWNYRTTLDSMGDAIHVVDADLRILLFNTTFRKWCEELGLETDVIGRTVTEVFPFLSDKIVDEYEQVFRDSKILITEEYATVGDKTLITETRKIPMIEGKKVVRVITVIRDITEQKQAEADKARLEAQLYQAQKLDAIGQLAGGVAHDFNNLLVVIMGNASMLQKDQSLPPKARDELADIAAAAERGSALTQQLLAYARGGIQQPTAIDLNGLIRALVPMLQRTAPAKIKFELKLEDGLPPILADPPRIEQVIVNLCLNAVQATKPPGTITLSTSEENFDTRQAVELQLKEGPYVRLRVQDQGGGIAPEIRERIFEPFFSTKEMGRGLGLFVSHGIIQSHRGQIRVDNTPARGASLSVWLPVADQAELALEPPTPKPVLDQAPRGSETILVIDDEIAATQTADRILSSLGYCVITYNDADQAIAFLGTNAEDVDLAMLHRRGGALATKIARQYPHIVMLLIGSPADIESAGLSKTSLAIREIRKPFTFMGLARAVRNALDEHAKQLEK